MNKYIQSDIRDGIGSLKVGIHNLIENFKSDLSQVETCPINRFILFGILQELNYSTLNQDEGFIIETVPAIKVIFFNNKTVFSI